MNSDFLEHSQHEITLEWLVENLRLDHFFSGRWQSQSGSGILPGMAQERLCLSEDLPLARFVSIADVKLMEKHDSNSGAYIAEM
jgi:hypothetical protein